MATNLIRFEVVIPQNDPSKWQFIVNFLNNLGTLCPFVVQNIYIQHDLINQGTYSLLVYGLNSSVQSATALGYLNQLNTDMGTPVQCHTWNVTTQP